MSDAHPPEEALDPLSASVLLERGEAVALDVREPSEWEAGRMPRSLHVPMRELGARLDELPRDRRLVVVCRSGSRSDVVAEALRRVGYPATNLTGGLQAWVAVGLPIEPEFGRIV